MNNSGGRRSSASPGPPPVVEIQEYAKKQFVLLDRVRGRFQTVDGPPGHDFQEGIQFGGFQDGSVDAAGPSGPRLTGGFSVPPYPQSPRIVLILPRSPEPLHRVPARSKGRREPVLPARQSPLRARCRRPDVQPRFQRVARSVRRHRRGRRAPGPAAAPRHRDRDRRQQLPAQRTRQARSGQPETTARLRNGQAEETPRPTSEKNIKMKRTNWKKWGKLLQQ